jgi:opacity protein-like surface antigen
MTKRLEVAALVALLCAVGQPALAQSRRISAQPPAVSGQPLGLPSWNGSWRSRIYVGASLGSSWTRFNIPGNSEVGINQITNVFVPGRGIVVVPGTTEPFLAASTNWKGAGVGGITVGYPIHSGSLEWAAESDLNFGSADGSIRQVVILPFTAIQTEHPVFMQRTFHSGWDWSLRARAGKLRGRTMLYATAGIAALHMSVDARDSTSNGGVSSEISVQAPAVSYLPSRTVSSESHLHAGFTFGGGVQRPLASRVDLAIEYRYTAFASHRYSNCTTDSTVTFSVNGSNLSFVDHRNACASVIGDATVNAETRGSLINSAANVVRPSRAQLIARVLFKQPWW